MKKANDKGFSLIELVIVIAIMAALVGVIMPTYFGYVEKSEEIARMERAENFRKCFDLAVVEVQAGGNVDKGGENLFCVSSAGRVSPETEYNKAIKKLLDESFGSDYEGLYVNVMYNASDGVPFQYYLLFEGEKDTYEYCYTVDTAMLENLQSCGYSEFENTGWYHMKSDAPVAIMD